MDHGHLRRLPRILLLCQNIHSPLLFAGLPVTEEAAVHHLRPHGLLHHLLLGRILHRHWPVQHPESRMGYHCDDELFRLRQAYLCHWSSRFGLRCHHTRLSHSNGSKNTHIMATKDILAICLLGWSDVSHSQARRKRWPPILIRSPEPQWPAPSEWLSPYSPEGLPMPPTRNTAS